jgi:hypothetical protein
MHVRSEAFVEFLIPGGRSRYISSRSRNEAAHRLPFFGEKAFSAADQQARSFRISQGSNPEGFLRMEPSRLKPDAS